ncbi:MAG: NUDIX domain-containing protein [Candidatus Micrarchaeia archaeon]
MDKLNIRNFKLKNYPGIAAIIINNKNKKILLLKRRNIPVIQNPGLWSFLFGGKKKNEKYIDAAYREIKEETGLKKDTLILLKKPIKILIFESRSKKCWYNYLFIFFSNTTLIKLSIENSKYRWANLSDIFNEKLYKNIFINKGKIEKLIKSSINTTKKRN